MRERSQPSFGHKVLLSLWEVAFVAPLQAVEWGVTWGGAVSIGAFLVLAVLRHYFPGWFSG